MIETESPIQLAQQTTIPTYCFYSALPGEPQTFTIVPVSLSSLSVAAKATKDKFVRIAVNGDKCPRVFVFGIMDSEPVLVEVCLQDHPLLSGYIAEDIRTVDWSGLTTTA